MIPFIDGHKGVQADPYSNKPHASSSGRDVVMDKHAFVLRRKGLRDSLGWHKPLSRALLVFSLRVG
jgi:hypothetical protein